MNHTTHENLLFQFIIIVYTSLKLSYIVAFRYEKIIQLTFWIYIYIFMGIAGMLQLLAATFPWPDTYSFETIQNAQIIVIIGLIFFDLGIFLSTKSDSFSTNSLYETDFQITPKSLILVTSLFIALSFLSIFLIGGISTLFMARNQAFVLASAIYPPTILSVIIGFAKTVPIAIFLLFSLLHKNKYYTSKLFVYSFIFLGIYVLIVNNPISTARFQVGMLFLSIVFMFFWNRNKAMIFAFFFIFSMLFLFPHMDAFRKSTDSSLVYIFDKLDVNNNQLINKADYDSFQMIMNGIEVVNKNDFTYGHQFMGSIFFMVPRAIWHNKADPTGVYIAKQSGYQFENLSAPLFIEFYLDGYLFFLGIGMMLYGFLCGKLEITREKFLKANKLSLIYIFTVFFAAYQLYFIRGSLMPVIANLALIPFTLYLYAMFNKKRLH